jgi:hypothetical protein
LTALLVRFLAGRKRAIDRHRRFAPVPMVAILRAAYPYVQLNVPILPIDLDNRSAWRDPADAHGRDAFRAQSIHS